MWLEILLTSVLGFVIYWFVSRDKEETLPLEDGWWGPGARPAAAEDSSIRPFKVETSEEEIQVRQLLQAGLSRGEDSEAPAGAPPRRGRAREQVSRHFPPTGQVPRETCPTCPLCSPVPSTPPSSGRTSIPCPSSSHAQVRGW